MKIVLKLLIGVLTVIGGIATFLVVFSFLHTSGNLGYSSFYSGLDTNSDDKLTYVEWMIYYGSHTHPLENCSREDFYHADCNQDDTLTWTEYHDFRFRHKRCESSAVLTFSQWRELNPKFDNLAKSKNYALSTTYMTGLQSVDEAYRKYISMVLIRENELKKKYGIEQNDF